MNWFDSVKSPKLKSSRKTNSNTPSGIWRKCVSCGEIVQNSKIEENSQVCPYCDHHYRPTAGERIQMLVDEGSFNSFSDGLYSKNPLEFHDKRPYETRLAEAKNKTGQLDSVIVGHAKINDHNIILAVMNFQFMGGSMGSVAGEKLAQAMEKAIELKRPLILVSCSGGARMQEGILSLMQMAKTSALCRKMKEEGVLYLSILSDPTTGGVAASFAMLGDIILAEPQALIGFAGPRVIEQSIRQKLPEGFQRSEFLLEHGFVDQIVHRHKLKEELAYFINFFKKTS